MRTRSQPGPSNPPPRGPECFGFHVIPSAKECLADQRSCSEHIWRKHTPFYRCGFCPHKWSISTARGKVTQNKKQHWETCEGKRRGMSYFERYDEDGTELLDADQQRLFAEIKSMRGNDRKLEALYEACGKPPPDTFCWSCPPGGGLRAISKLLACLDTWANQGFPSQTHL